MTQLFAALDREGAIRFADQVPRGSACGCVCPVCFSPLVAKQGDQLQWHFAHESGQERPECEVGALNLLIRIATEHLRQPHQLVLPAYEVTVSVRHLRQRVSWSTQFVPDSLLWSDRPTKNTPVARGRLDNGLDAELSIMVTSTPPRFPPVTEPLAQTTQLVYWFPMPHPSDLHKLTDVTGHISRTGRFSWVHQRDVFGLVGNARERLLQQIQKEETTARYAAGLKWAALDKRLHEPNIESLSNRQPLPQNPFPDPSPDAIVYPWAPDKKPRSAFIFYRLRDETAWILYTQSDGQTCIVPWPAFDGWD